MNIIIVGGGKKIHFLSKSFISKGHNVTVINDDKQFCDKLAKRYKAKIVNGDGTKPYILEDAEITAADLVIALTPKDQDNLVICQLALKLFGVKKTLALVNDPGNIEVFDKLGVDTTISTPGIISSLIEQKVFVDQITNLIPLEEGKVAVVELEIHKDYPVVEKNLKTINIPDQAIISCIVRKGNPIIPGGGTVIKPEDKVIILTLPEIQSEVLKVLTGRLE